MMKLINEISSIIFEIMQMQGKRSDQPGIDEATGGEISPIIFFSYVLKKNSGKWSVFFLICRVRNDVVSLGLLILVR